MHILKSVAAFLLAWQTCAAQVDAWERVKLIEAGKKVSVKSHSGRTVSGKMETWSADGIAVRQGKNRVVQVKKTDVAQVSLVIGRSRGRKALLAGVIAGAIGGAAAAGATAAIVSEGRAAVIAGVGGAAFAGGVAAGIAALLAPHNEVIYSAPRKAVSLN